MGLHTEITLSFLVVGHTKFAPDWCFGLFKRLYRKTKVGSLKAIASVVDNSAKCNVAQLVVDDDGTVIVPTHDWTDLFAPHFRKFEGIKKYHHFRFLSSEPGVMYAKFHSDSKEEVKFQFLKDSWSPGSSDFPSQIFPKGLSVERQWYLFDSIREFCPPEDRDVTCPEPTVPKPRSRAGTPAIEHPAPSTSTPVEDDSTPLPPTAKKRRVCGTCRREVGHARTGSISRVVGNHTDSFLYYV